MIENLEKLQLDRGTLQSVMVATLDEVEKHGTFNSLIDSNEEYKEEKNQMEKTIVL